MAFVVFWIGCSDRDWRLTDFIMVGLVRSHWLYCCVTDSDSCFGVYPGISLLFLIPSANGRATWVDENEHLGGVKDQTSFFFLALAWYIMSSSIFFSLYMGWLAVLGRSFVSLSDGRSKKGVFWYGVESAFKYSCIVVCLVMDWISCWYFLNMGVGALSDMMYLYVPVFYLF